jgi:hypothetical protein
MGIRGDAAFRVWMPCPREGPPVQLLAEVGTEAVGSTSDELDVLTRQRFAL